MQNAGSGTEMLTDGFEDEIDSVTPRSPAGTGAEVCPPERTLRLFADSPTGNDRLDFKLAAAAVLSSGTGSDEDEVSEVESFILDQEDLDNPVLKTASELLLSTAAEGADFRTVDPETQARLEALLEAAGIGKLSTADGKAFADPEVLRRLTSSVSCALDEAAAALTRMRADNNFHTGQVDNRSLAEACSDGDVNAVRKLLNEGRSVNEYTEEGESLLYLACSAGYYELAQVLLAMHASVEDRGNKGDITPLMAAASGGFVDIVKLLLIHSADVNAQSSTGNTALTYACAAGFVDVVKVLLKEGANIEDHNENGHTPLMEAASAGHVDVARILLENGAGINTHSNEFKESALTLACYKGHLEMVRFLLEAGADQEHKTDEMHTALMEACMDGHVAVARLLLDSGAQVNMPADSFESPLTLAACGGHVELAALLIERGANLEEVNDEGYTPLMEAAREGHEEIVALLLAQGANINAQTEETQETALTLACCGGFAEVSDFLVKSGADIELGCSTPLMEAAQEGHLELVKYLLAAGANVHATTATGDTALTYACENGHTDVAEVLLQAGADLEHESEGGRTPLMKAARAGHLCTIQFLIRKGANINRATANNDHTVVSLACAGGHLAVVEQLLAHGADPTYRLKDGSTMLIEAAKGGHTNVVSYLLDYPNNVLTVPSTDICQITPPPHDQLSVSRVPMHALAMVVPPQEPDKSPEQMDLERGASTQIPYSLHLSDQDLRSPFHPYQPLECIVEETEGKLNELGQRISAIEKAQLKSLELIQGEPLNKDKIEELKKNREEQAQKKKKILKELQKVERQLQIKTQQQFTKEGLETAPNKDTAVVQPCLVKSTSPPIVTENISPEENSSELHQVNTVFCEVEHKVLPPSAAEQIGFIPIQSLPMPFSKLPSDLGIAEMDYHDPKIYGSNSALDQPPITSQILSSHVTDGLMVASPAQTLNETLDDIMAAVNNRVPSEPFNSPQSTTVSSPMIHSTSANVVQQPLLSTFPSVDIDAHTESNHDTALTLGCAGGHEELVSVLITRCANIEHRDKKGFTPLILAATAGHVGVVEILLDKGADIEAQSERTKDTPLSLACSGGRQEVVELLLSRGANKEHRNVSDYTPLSLAASGGYVNIIKILLNAGAEINSRTGSKLGISPLMLAAMNGHVPAVKLLLDMGSDINAQIETNRNTALTLACFQGRAEVVSLLLDRKANVEHRAKTGLTPLMEAASGGYAEVGRVLLDKGADVNSPPVPSSRDTALTIAADKGHYKFCELLIDRNSHIDVRNKKGNTPLWLAANGGHFDVVQLLIHAGADVDAADNRKITPLMSAFRKGHLKVVQFLVKEVNQFPSDIECMRYIATITDKDLLKKCHQCMETIVKAKDQQAAEANKNASILLKELDLEKSREESRKQALAAKREKRKEKRKKKRNLQKKKLEDDEDCKLSGNCDLLDDANDVDEEDDVPLEPPSATTTTTIGISATSVTFTNVFGKRGNVITPSTNQKTKKNKTKDTSSNLQIIVHDQHLSIAQQTSDNLFNGEPRGGSANGNSDCDYVGDNDCNNESSISNLSQEHNGNSEVNTSGGRKHSSLLLHNCEEKSKILSSKLSARLENDVNHSTPSNCKTIPLTLPNMKLNVSSPKRGQKREEGWKEVVRRSKKLSVPASVVSRIMGRGGCNVTAIQDVTGAHIDVDKQKDKNGERMITIRGGTESTRYAVQLINALIQDPAKELEDLIPKTHIRSPKSITNSSSGAGMMSSNRTAFSFGTSTVTTSQTSVLPAFQASSRPNKNMQATVHPPFPGTLPLPYTHPHFALLAAQTMQQIRHPRLPMTQFGGTFNSSPSTWGPFPVRSASPSSANNSPKHNTTGRSSHQMGHMTQIGSNNATLGNQVSASPVTIASQQLSMTNSPSSARKQLFPCSYRTSTGTSGTSTVTSVGATIPSMFSTTINNGSVSSAISNEAHPEHFSSKNDVFSPSQGNLTAADQAVEMYSPSSIHGIDNPSCTSDQISDQSSLNPSAQQNIKDEILSSSISERNEPIGAAFMNNLVSTSSNRYKASEPLHNCRVPQTAAATDPHVSHRMQYKGSLYSMIPTKQIQQDAQSFFVTDPESSSNQDLLQQSNKPTQLPTSPMSNSQIQFNLASKQLPPSLGPALFNHFSNLLDSQVSCSQSWGGCQLSPRTTEQSFSEQSTYLDNAMLGHIENHHSLDGSKVPGFRPSSQRVSSGSLAASFDGSDPCSLPTSMPLTNFTANLHASQVFLQGPSVGTPSFSRQHFSPHPWTNSSSSCESPVPSASSGSSPPLSSVSSPPSLGQMQPVNLTNDRKIPPPIGTERLARIRQSGYFTSCAVGNTFSAPVGHTGIWSFGMNSGSEGFPGWSQPVMGTHAMHQPLPDNTVFSQHQQMERDESGMLNPSNLFHQPIPSTVVDFSKGVPLSMYGGKMITSHQQLTEIPGAPIFNGLNTHDATWSPLVKVVPNSAECTDAHKNWSGTWTPHVGAAHLKYVN
ncbi:ankyrin repeat and KH domain-containing protein 1 isoform X2 [Pseudophryne corroboree]|uniref:ankyrin repeat and KH domain-containing protein 1 isoform X2 n=1 Tax=Pseudophryne corroboree TaxID=495146 RepID=UPI003081F1C6